jgi:hypothetical protein
VPNAAVVIRDLRNAWKHDTLQKSKPEIEARVRKAPVLIKPGATQQAEPGNTAQIKSLKQQIKQTGGNSTKAVADLFLATGKV